MMRIFAGIRRILAYSRAARGIGEIASAVVRDNFVPRLERMIAKEEDSMEKERLGALLADYRLYAKRGTAEYRDLEDTAEAAVVQEVQRFGLSEQWQDEAAQMVALDFFQPLTKEGKALLEDLNRFKAEDAGTAFEYTKWFSRMVKMRAHWRLRELVRRNPDVFNKEEPEEGKRDVVENIRDRGPLPGEDTEDEYLKDMKPELDRYVLSGSRDAVAKDLYLGWWKAIGSKGAGNVNMDKDVYPRLISKYGVSRSGLSERTVEMKRLIERFFNEVMGKRFTDRLKRQLKMSSVELVVRDEFCRRFASWMLGI